LATALLALVALGALYASIFWVTSEASTRSLRVTVDTDLAGLADIYASGGRKELIQRLSDRKELVSIAGRRAHYLLANDQGQALAGDAVRWPTLDARLSEQGYVTLSDGRPVYARATLLAPDLRLLVAREYGPDLAQMRQLNWTFAAVALLILLAALLLSHFAGQRLLDRVARITQALGHADTAGLQDGPRATNADEIDLLASTSADLIGRATRLAEMHRHMSDHVAHEIRTPLMHLDYRLLNAQRNDDDPATRRTELETARRDIRGIAALLDSLLDHG
jgi:signal transduction histidine kinase